MPELHGLKDSDTDWLFEASSVRWPHQALHKPLFNFGLQCLQLHIEKVKCGQDGYYPETELLNHSTEFKIKIEDGEVFLIEDDKVPTIQDDEVLTIKHVQVTGTRSPCSISSGDPRNRNVKAIIEYTEGTSVYLDNNYRLEMHVENYTLWHNNRAVTGSLQIERPRTGTFGHYKYELSFWNQTNVNCTGEDYCCEKSREPTPEPSQCAYCKKPIFSASTQQRHLPF